MTAARSPGQRAGLSRRAVLDSARDLLDESGPDALSMRTLAARLGVAPNTVYSHVASKADLLDALLDDLLAEVTPPAADVPDPLAGLADLMTSTYDVLTAHPSLVPLLLVRQGARGRNAVSLGEVMDVLLTRAGVEADAVGEARGVLIVHTIGFAAFALGAVGAAGAAADAGLPVDTDRARASFLRGLGWLVAGIARG